MKTIQTETLRAVLDAARSYASEPGIHEGTPGRGRLMKAVQALEAEIAGLGPNVATGFVVSETWAEIPAGWFVKVPNGEWWEVMATEAIGARQNVTLRAPNGNRGTWPRDPAGSVKARRGSRDVTLNTALAALSVTFPGTEVIHDDSPPWDE